MANAYDASKHDIGIKYSGTTYGLMLAQEEYEYNGVKHTRPIYQTLIDEYLAEQQATGQPGYEHLPVEKELSFIGQSYRAGFGEEFYDPADPERYNTSIGMDLRHKDMAIMSNKATAIATLPTTTDPTILDPGFADWNNGALNQWEIEAGSITEDEVVYRTTPAVELAGGTIIFQDLSTTEIQGRRFTATVYTHPSDASHCRIGLYDGNDTVWGNYNTGTGSWEQLTVTRTLAQDASELRIYIKVDAGGAQEEFDDVAITRATYTNPTAHCFFNGIQYVAFGPLLTKEDSNGDEFEAVYEFHSPISDMHVFSDGFMYIAQEATTVIEDCETAWTAGTGDTTPTADAGDFKIGSASCKLVYNGGGANGVLIAYEAITLDARDFAGVKLWIKADIAVNANDLELFFSDANDGSTTDDIMKIPALLAGQWTQIWLRQADPSSNIGILSIGLEYHAGEKANTFHIDAVRQANSYWYMDSGENLTQSTLAVLPADSFAKFFQEVGATMWKSLPPNRIFSSTDPSNTAAANWSTATIVDTPTHEITALASDGASLYIGKEDKTFYLVGATVTVLIGETGHMHSAASGKNLFVWKNKVYAPAGAQGLVEYDAGTVTWRSPSMFSTRVATFNGTVQALAGDEEWLFAIIDNNVEVNGYTDVSVEILAGRSEVIGGTTRWVWHPLTGIPDLAACSIAFVTNDYQKRLYIGSTNSANSFYYIPLPINYGDIVNCANCDVPTSGTRYFTTPKLHFNFRGDLKTAIKITAELGHPNDSSIYFECHIKMGDGGWVDAGNLKGDSGTRIATLYFAANTTDRNIQLKFVGITNDAAKTPVLLWYDLRAILYPSRRNLIACTVRAADKILDKAGSEMTTTAANIRTYLEAARDATYPVDFEDFWSNAKKVRVLALKGQPFSAVHKQALGENVEEHFALLLEEVTTSG